MLALSEFCTRRLLPVAVSCFALLGCKNSEGTPGQSIDRAAVTDQLVDAVCEPFALCDCEDATPIQNGADCATAVRPSIEAGVANATDLGMRFFPECRSLVEKYVDLLSCDSADEIDPALVAAAAFDAAQCKVVAGTSVRGAPCQVIDMPSALFVGDTCAHDLLCDGTLCRPIPSREGDWCGGTSSCPGELACVDPDGDGILHCAALAAKNEVCNPHDTSPCEADLFCDIVQSACSNFPGMGEACPTGQCGEDLACVGQFCQILPAVGEACPEFICEPGAGCDPTSGMCVAAPDRVGDMCPLGVCSVGLSCGPDDTCLRNPAAVCTVAANVGLCHYVGDGICDEPAGTGLCAKGTDQQDCANGGVSGSAGGTGTGGTGGTGDPTGGAVCMWENDDSCDVPELCPEGTDLADCSGASSGG